MQNINNLEFDDVSEEARVSGKEVSRESMKIIIRNAFPAEDNYAVAVKCSFFYKHPITEKRYKGVHIVGDWEKIVESGQTVTLTAKTDMCVRAFAIEIIILKHNKYIKGKRVRRPNIERKCWIHAEYECKHPI